MQAPPEMSVVDAPSPAADPQSSADDDLESIPDPNKSIVDLDARRVYLPGTGWVGGDAFLDLYMNRPEELPGDIDSSAVHELANLLMSQES